MSKRRIGLPVAAPNQERRHVSYIRAETHRHNRAVRIEFEDLVRAGKPRKVAVTAVMRKLIVLANALIRGGRKWAPEPG